MKSREFKKYCFCKQTNLRINLMSVITVSDLKPNDNKLEALSPLQAIAVYGGSETTKEYGRRIGIILGIISDFF
jgi:hypothetical protein